VDVEGLGGADVVLTPHPGDERPPVEHPAWVLHQELEEPVLLAGEVEALAVDGDLASNSVERHRSHPEDPAGVLALGHRRPAKGGSHPGHQLPHPATPGHVVVGPNLEGQHRVHLGHLRHHDDRQVGVGPDPATQVEAVELGQGQVDEHQVRATTFELSQSLGAVRRQPDDETLLAQVGGQGFREDFVSFDDEDDRPRWRCGPPRPARAGGLGTKVEHRAEHLWIPVHGRFPVAPNWANNRQTPR